MTDAFFEAQTDESRLKTEIVEAFFVGWARVLGGYQKQKKLPIALAYVELYAGPGVYFDGNESTPVVVLKRVLQNDDWRPNMLLFLNEAEPSLLELLKRNIVKVQEREKRRLSMSPIFTNQVIDSDYSECLRFIEDRPTLFFVDPWGYIGITLRLLRDLVSGFGNDLIFFFNYRRINAAVANDLFRARMDELFGSRSESLRAKIANLHGIAREQAIIQAAMEEISENVGEYVQRFRFGGYEDEASHYLFFVSKHPRGHKIMSDIMAGRSSVDQFGQPTFGITKSPQLQGGLFAIDPIEQLANDLRKRFRGEKLSVETIHRIDSAGKQLQMKQYKAALRRLEARGHVEATPPAEQRQQGTLADHVIIRFIGNGGEG